jgi:hypothetical protein
MRSPVLIVLSALAVMLSAQVKDESGVRKPPPGSHEAASHRNVQARPRETIFEFYLRALNPHRVHWGNEIDDRIEKLAEQSVLNPCFHLSAIQTGLILALLLVCWVWWDKMGQIKWLAAACLADALNAKRIAEQKALQAIEHYNRHIAVCNRVIEGEESGLPGTNSVDAWRQEVLSLKNKLTAEEAKTLRLQKSLEDREGLQVGLEERLRQLEAVLQERQGEVSAELIARLQRAEAQLSSRKATKRGTS